MFLYCSIPQEWASPNPVAGGGGVRQPALCLACDRGVHSIREWRLLPRKLGASPHQYESDEGHHAAARSMPVFSTAPRAGTLYASGNSARMRSRMSARSGQTTRAEANGAGCSLSPKANLELNADIMGAHPVATSRTTGLTWPWSVGFRQIFSNKCPSPAVSQFELTETK